MKCYNTMFQMKKTHMVALLSTVVDVGKATREIPRTCSLVSLVVVTPPIPVQVKVQESLDWFMEESAQLSSPVVYEGSLLTRRVLGVSCGERSFVLHHTLEKDLGKPILVVFPASNMIVLFYSVLPHPGPRTNRVLIFYFWGGLHVFFKKGRSHSSRGVG